MISKLNGKKILVKGNHHKKYDSELFEEIGIRRYDVGVDANEGELKKESVWAKFAYTASDGKTYQVDYYNLDIKRSDVGYF